MSIGAYRLVSGSQGTGSPTIRPGKSLQYGLANPCVLQWRMLLNDGVILDQYNGAVNLAILVSFTMSIWGCIHQDLVS